MVMVLLCGLVPLPVGAQVVITEFLYDASGTDVDQEFVEIYNAGAAPVDLTKWKINDGSNHTLNVPPKNGGMGSITLAPGEFALLVDNASNFLSAHSNLSGIVIDTVLSLPNTSGTITLVDESGATGDTVSYHKDQGGAGDGNSLQKSGTSWIAAAPTALAANATSATAPVTTDAPTPPPTNDQVVSAPSSPVSSYVPPPVPQVFADAGGDRTVIAGADTIFNGRAYNREKESVDHVRFMWNFGDGSTGEGPTVAHHYDYPGRYALVLTIADNKDAVSDRIVVTAEPAKLAFATLADGSVSIENRALRDLDLSGWIVRQFGQMFTLPEHSVILANESMRIPQKTLKFWSSAQAELQYPNGVVALYANQTSLGGTAADTSPALQSKSTGPVSEPVASSVPAYGTTRAPDRQIDEDVPETSTPVSAPVPVEAQVAAAALSGLPAQAGATYWWLGALGLAVFAAAGVFIVRRISAKEWDIAEEG